MIFKEEKIRGSERGKFCLDFKRAVSKFENSMHKFPVKKILYKSVFKGKGLEFDSYRAFSPDDDASLIDWKATLRSGGELLVRRYVEERDLNIYFLVDVSSSMLFGSGEKLKAEYSAELIASLSHLIIDSGDKVGLFMVNDKIVRFLRPSRAKNHFFIITKFLSDSGLYGGGFDLNRALEHILRFVNSKYTVFIIVSDFLFVKKDVSRNLKLMGQRYETISLILRDPLDESLPDVKVPIVLEDPYGSDQMIVEPYLIKKAYQEEVLFRKKRLIDLFKFSNIDFLEVYTNEDFSFEVSSFLKKRAKGGRI